MGEYDSVFIKCPKCFTKLELQSKSGECGFKKYSSDSVPLGIAGDLDGDEIYCDICTGKFVAETPNKRTRITLRDKEDADNYD